MTETEIRKKIDRVKKQINDSIRRQTVTIFKRIFKPKKKLKSQNLSGESLLAFKKRKQYNKVQKNKTKLNFLAGSQAGDVPSQGKRKYLSNMVKYIAMPFKSVIYLAAPFGKTLDQGGSSTAKVKKTPYDLFRLDVAKVNGQSYYGFHSKFKNQDMNNKVVSFKSADRKQIRRFKKGSVRVDEHSKRKQFVTKRIQIKKRPFISRIMDALNKQQIVQNAIKQFAHSR